jgi:chorismate mutase
MVHIVDQNKIDYKDLYEVETTYDDILSTTSDVNAPYVLAEFVRMLPKYHNVAVVDVDERYQTAETVQEIIESIRKYFESKGVSQ